MTDKTQIDPITHEDERVNIPTPELAPMMDPDDARPIKAAYDLRNPDLDPQLIWRGKDIDQAEADLKGYIDSLLKTYKTKGKAKTVGREFVVEFLNQLSPKEVKSINGMNTAFDSFKGKLDRIEKKLSEMATKLNDLIDAQEVLQRDIDRKVKKELDNRDYTSKRLPTLNTKIAKMHTATAKKVAEVSEAIGKVADARKRETDYKKSIAALNGKKPDWASKLEKLITLGDLALGAGFTDFSKLDQILVLIDSVGVEIDNVLAEEV